MPTKSKTQLKLKDKLKQVLLDRGLIGGKPHKTDFLPSDVQDAEASVSVAGEYYSFGVIVGDQIGPDGYTQGAYAIADGKSGNVNRFPLPSDPADPRAVFIENGYVGLLKSIGTESKIVEIPGKGWLHFRKENVRDMTKPEMRQHPLKEPPKVIPSSLVEKVNPDFFEDPEGPNLGGKRDASRTGLVIYAAQRRIAIPRWREEGVDFIPPKIETLKRYVGQDDVYFTMNELPAETLGGSKDSWKLSLNPTQQWDTPFGIYAYPFTAEYYQELIHGSLPFRAKAENVIVFRVKPAAKLLRISEYTDEDLANDLSKLDFPDPNQYTIRSPCTECSDDPGKITVSCSDCAGTGSEPNGCHGCYGTGSIEIDCDQCDGEGTIEVSQPCVKCDSTGAVKVECFECNGKGETYSECNTCDGAGIKEEECDSCDGSGEIKQNAFEKAKGSTAAAKLWNLTRLMAKEQSRQFPKKEKSPVQLAKRAITRWTFLLRQLGYSGATDNGEGLIHHNEPDQAVFFSSQPLEILGIVPNPNSSHKERKQEKSLDSLLRLPESELAHYFPFLDSRTKKRLVRSLVETGKARNSPNIRKLVLEHIGLSDPDVYNLIQTSSDAQILYRRALEERWSIRYSPIVSLMLQHLSTEDVFNYVTLFKPILSLEVVKHLWDRFSKHERDILLNDLDSYKILVPPNEIAKKQQKQANEQANEQAKSAQLSSIVLTPRSARAHLPHADNTETLSLDTRTQQVEGSFHAKDSHSSNFSRHTRIYRANARSSRDPESWMSPVGMRRNRRVSASKATKACFVDLRRRRGNGDSLVLVSARRVAGKSHFKNVSVADLRKALKSVGFKLINTVGDHEHWKNSTTGKSTYIDTGWDPVDPNVLVGDLPEQTGLTQGQLLKILGRPVPPSMVEEVPTKAPAPDPLLTMTVDQFMEQMPSGYDLVTYVPGGDLVGRSPDGIILLTDGFFEASSDVRAKALHRLT